MKLFSRPLLCNYYLTYRCNASCSFCDIWEKPSPYVEPASFEANLRDLKRLGVRVIDFTGGEPLLHRELAYFLKRAKAEGFITTVTTNGLLYPKYAQSLKGNIDMLHFSLDYADGLKHNQKRGVNCFDFVLKSIQVAKELNEKPDILFTVMDENINELENLYHNIVLPNDLILIVNPIFSYNGVKELLSFHHFSYLRKFAKQKNVFLNEAFLKLREAGGNKPEKNVCLAGDAVVVIAPDNSLLLPCYHASISSFPIKNNLYELWTSLEVRKARALQGKIPACNGCTINCYMQPSFSYQLSKYFWQSLPSTLKYAREKWGYLQAIKYI